MTPPKASPVDSVKGDRLEVGFSVSEPGSKKNNKSSLAVIQKRADFLRASRAWRVAMPGFVLQVYERGDQEPLRAGFTCSKKVGNAVARNRAKRRLREIARLTLAPHGQVGTDYVLIGRREKTATLDFQQLLGDLKSALEKHAKHKRAQS